MAAIYLTEADVERLLDMRLAIEVCRRGVSPAGRRRGRQRAAGARPGAGHHAALDERGGRLSGPGRLEVLHDHAQRRAVSRRTVRRRRRAGGADRSRPAGPTAHRRHHRRGRRGDGRCPRRPKWACSAPAGRPKASWRPSPRRGRSRWPTSTAATSRSANDFADTMSEQLGIDVRPVDRPQEAAEDLPIVVTATTSREPVFDGTWLAEGTLVCAVGSNWLDQGRDRQRTSIRRADNIVCDSVEGLPERGRRFRRRPRKGHLRLVARRRPGRRGDRQRHRPQHPREHRAVQIGRPGHRRRGPGRHGCVTLARAERRPGIAPVAASLRDGAAVFPSRRKSRTAVAIGRRARAARALVARNRQRRSESVIER